uniref:Secreted protein n=1 Tax=Oryza brachyantha TaxID=4533 RepID=J3LP18_ORYBR
MQLGLLLLLLRLLLGFLMFERFGRSGISVTVFNPRLAAFVQKWKARDLLCLTKSISRYRYLELCLPHPFWKLQADPIEKKEKMRKIQADVMQQAKQIPFVL